MIKQGMFPIAEQVICNNCETIHIVRNGAETCPNPDCLQTGMLMGVDEDGKRTTEPQEVESGGRLVTWVSKDFLDSL